MPIEAPLSKHKKSNLIIYIIVLLVLAAWCAYDGYFNENWIADHTDAQGNPEPYLVFNKKAPAFFLGAAVLLGIYFITVRKRKIIAEQNQLIISNKEKISYDSIQKIDKTYFQTKGFFIIIYTDTTGRQVNRKLTETNFDNLEPILDELVAKIS